MKEIITAKQHQMLSIIMILFVFDEKLLPIVNGAIQTNITDNVAFIQGSSSKNQLGGPYPTKVAFGNIDGLNGYTLFSNNTLGYQSGGIYFATYATQIGSPSKNGKGEVHIWVRRGNENKPNTNSIQTVDRGGTSVLIYQTVFEASLDHLGIFVYSVYTANPCSALGLIVTSPENEPVVPSIINSIIQITDLNNIAPYAQLSSPDTQLGNLTPTALRINIAEANNVLDLTTSGTDGAIKYNTSGLYFIMASGQVGSDINTFGSGEVHLWTRLNEVDVPNSNTIQTIRTGSTAVLVSQTIVTLKANDTLKLMFSSTDNRLGMIASTPINESATPSMIFSTFRLRNEGESLPYAQLSSSKSQWGCLTPQVIVLDRNDGSQYITNNNGTILFNAPGTYFLMAAAQVGSDGRGGLGDVHLWFRLNGQDMANSNTIQTVNNDTAVLVCQTAVVLQIGDQLQLIFSTDVTTGTLGIVATYPQNEPTVPSMIFSAFRSSYSDGVLISHNSMNVGGD